MPTVPITLYTDPGCPFAYSALPALTRLRWRFGDQLDWRMVMIGLTETPEQYEERGYAPADMVLGARRFRRHGMPFGLLPKERVAATARACRALIAVRRQGAALQWPALRALHLLQFTTERRLDDDGALEDALATVAGLDAAAAVAAIDDPEVLEAYEDERAEARTAAGTAAAAQGKTAAADGPERFTAPSLLVDDRWLAGGFQPYAVYDALLANVDPALERRAPAEDATAVLAAFPEGLTTAEVGAAMTPGIDEPAPGAGEEALVAAAADGAVTAAGTGEAVVWRREIGHIGHVPAGT